MANAAASTVLDDYGNSASDGPRRRLGGRACGLWDPAATYYAMDVVAFNGSEWRANRDDPGPLPGDGWHLGAKGSRGDKGKMGLHVRALDVVGYTLVLTLSDGKTLHANLLPALELFAREKGSGHAG